MEARAFDLAAAWDGALPRVGEGLPTLDALKCCKSEFMDIFLTYRKIPRGARRRRGGAFSRHSALDNERISAQWCRRKEP
jgi:hypothetical protein